MKRKPANREMAFTISCWREYKASIHAEGADQIAELRVLYSRESRPQPAAKLIEEAPDLSGEDGAAR